MGWFGVVLLLTISTTLGSSLCPHKCQCDDENLIVTCIKADLENMPNTLHPRLKTIVYKYNNFHTVDVSLKFLPELLKIDLGHNRIVSVSDKAFSSQRKSQELKLGSNKITKINEKTFYGLTNLKVLDLRGNNIQEIPANVFKYCKKIQEIDLSKNRISTISPDAFKDLTDLKILHLSGNFIESLTPLLSKLSFNLAELYLSSNPLKSLDSSQVFNRLSSLLTLDLSSCQIDKLSPNSFKGLRSLRKLKLSDNNLTSPTIQRGTFLSTPNLEELYLGQNPFKAIDGQGLQDIKHLKHLDISGCDNLRYVASDVLRGSTDRLEVIIIAENRHLSAIHENAIRGNDDSSLIKLRRVDLGDNGLTGISDSLLPWHRLRYLDLSGNPWNCNCDFVFAQQVLNKLIMNMTRISGVIPDAIASTTCAQPKFLRDKPVHALKLSDFNNNLNNHISSGNSKCIVPPGSAKGLVIDDSGGSSAGIETERLLVIISVVIVVSVLVLVIGTFIAIRCRKSFGDHWIIYKDYRWKVDQTVSTMERDGGTYGTKSTTSTSYGGPDCNQDFFIQLAQQGTISRPIPVTEL